MKKLMLNLIGGFILVGLIGFSAATTKAENLASYISENSVENTIFGEQDFVLINKTGVEIYALYITPHSAGDWGEDVLGVDTLPPGESVVIRFSPRERATYWDLRVEDEDGNYIEWDKFNLKRISKIALYYNNGKATAVID